jgi:hypothetical protein
MQCIAGAMTAGAAASGSRAWLGVHAARWLTPRRRRVMTVVLVVGGVLAGGVIGPTA